MDELSRLAGRPYAFIFRYARRRALSHVVIVAAVLAAVACSITTQYGVKYLVDALTGSGQSHAVWLAFALLVSLIAADNILWRLGRLDRQFFVRARDRRSAPRPVSPPDRAFAALFCRPPARHADEPRDRDIQRGLHRREHVRLERAAALRRDRRGDRFRDDDQPADGADARGGRRRGRDRDVPSRRRRQAAASRIRRQGGRRRRRDGRRDRQHVAGARVLRHAARASPLRRARSAAR